MVRRDPRGYLIDLTRPDKPREIKACLCTPAAASAMAQGKSMFGMSVFHSVLQRLAQEEGQEAVHLAPSSGSSVVMGLNAGFVADLAQNGVTDGTAVSRAYFETSGDEMLQPPKPVPPPVMPDRLQRTEPEQIARDLGVGDHDTRSDLIEKRRRFASLNHPDTHLPQFRAQATIRMKIANMIVDEALSRLPANRKS